MNFLKIGYIVVIISLIQSNLYSQKTYSQGFFETDKDFTDRVIYNFLPSIDSFEKSNYTSSGIFEDGESISYERGFMFRFCFLFPQRFGFFSLGRKRKLYWKEV